MCIYIIKLLILWFVFKFAFVQTKSISKRSLNIPGSVDGTLIPGEVGENVVTASIQKIENLEIFSNDFGFLKRIAKVESDFGTNYTTADANKGIWQISPFLLTTLQLEANHIAIASQVASIQSHFGNDIVNFTNLDLSIPLNSAVAVRLYIDLVAYNSSIPGNLSNQALWWASVYNLGGSKIYFISEISAFEAIKECPNHQVDLWFLVDASSSIGNEHFLSALDFINHLSSKFLISPTHARFGMSVYASSTSITTVSNFDEDTSNVEFQAAVNGTVYLGGQTFTGSAMTHTINNGFNVKNGARPETEGIPRVLVVLTDGYSVDSVDEAAENARLAGITTFAIGVGNSIKLNELHIIASYPYSKFVYSVNSYEDLISVVSSRLATDSCDLSAQFPTNTPTEISLNISAGETKFTYIDVPRTGDVTINFEVSSGSASSGLVYISTLANPTSFQHIIKSNVNEANPLTLLITNNVLAPSSGTTYVLNSTSLNTGIGPISLYFSNVADPSKDFVAKVTAIYVLPTTTSTFSPTTVNSTTVDVVVLPISTLNQWEIMLIVSASIIVALVTVAIVLIAIGISNSSSYPKVTDGIVCSVCACLCSIAVG